VNAALLIPGLVDLFHRHPEFYDHEPWELQWRLFALNYVQVLVPEEDIALAAVWARRTLSAEAA
jgi:hypothetical protein